MKEAVKDLRTNATKAWNSAGVALQSLLVLIVTVLIVVLIAATDLLCAVRSFLNGERKLPDWIIPTFPKRFRAQ